MGGGRGLASNPGIPGVPKCQQFLTSSQWRYMYKGKQLTTGFSYVGQNVKKMLFFWGRPSMIHTGPIWLSSYPLTHITQNFRAARPHHRADMCITLDKNNQFLSRPGREARHRGWAFRLSVCCPPGKSFRLKFLMYV